MAPDLLDRPEPLIRRVRAYVAYRIGEGPLVEGRAGRLADRDCKALG